MAYVTTANLKVYLGITTNTDDTLLGTLIDQAQAAIDAYTGRTFEHAATGTARYFDAEADVDGRTLWLDKDLCSITSVVNGDGVTLTTADYVTEPRNDTPYNRLTLKASSSYVWTYTTTPENAITITGKWAYSATAPNAIILACTRLAAFLYQQKDNHTDAPMLVGDVAVMPIAMPADVQLYLKPFLRKGPA